MQGGSSDISAGPEEIARASDLFTVASLQDVILNNTALGHGQKTALAAHFQGQQPNWNGYFQLLDAYAKTGKINPLLKNQLIVGALNITEGNRTLNALSR